MLEKHPNKEEPERPEDYKERTKAHKSRKEFQMYKWIMKTINSRVTN